MVLAIVRDQQIILNPAPSQIVHAGDCLTILGRDDRVQKLNARGVAVERRDDLPGGEDAIIDLTESSFRRIRAPSARRWRSCISEKSTI